MTPRTCPRAWQAEAAHDGRLSHRDARSFERHRTTCEVCEGEAQALLQLRHMAGRLPVLTSSPLEHRRARLTLLRRANRHTMDSPPPPWMGMWMRRLAMAAALAAAVASVLWLRSRPLDPPTPLPTAGGTPTFEVVASPGAEWRTVERGSTVRVRAGRGRFELTVQRLNAGQRFLLELPDGEVEVVGTRFVVEADQARTLGVRVLEGVVALRLRGRPSSTLSAGEDWVAEAPGVAPAASAATEGTAAPASPSTPRASAATEGTPAPRAGTTTEGTPAAPPRPRGSAPSQSSPGKAFSEAMAAFSAGDYGSADTLFSRFARNHPGDSRVEDATFLRAVARARRGDRDGARALARDYLRRFPSGLRRVEATRLAQE